MSERQHTDYRVQESRVACDKARFDTEFSGNFGKTSKAAVEREKFACGDFTAQLSMRNEVEEKARKEGEQLKRSIEKALTNEEAQAEMQAAALKTAVSAVAVTAKAVVEEIKK
jgi:hypothetical protein